MKKLIGTAMLAALLATSAFAQEGISFSAWNNSLYVISHDDGNNVESEFAQPWATGGSRFGSLNIVGNSENAGFQAELHFDKGGALGFGQLYSYIKPIEQIQLIFGFTDQNYLRSDNVAYMYNYYRPGAFNIGEGSTFGELEFSGIGLVVTPMDALKIVAGYNVALDGTPHELNEQIGRSGKLGAAYTIENIGTVKASFVANGFIKDTDFKKGGADKDGNEKDKFTVGVAFDLTAIEGVFVTVGAKIPLGGVYSDDGRDPVRVAAGVSLNLIENLGIQLNFDSKIDAPKSNVGRTAAAEKDGNFGFAIELGADYAFAETWKVFGAVGYASEVYNNTKDSSKDALTFGVGIEKAWSNGALGVAVVGMTNDSNFYFIKPHNDTAFNWAIPIRMNVSF